MYYRPEDMLEPLTRTAWGRIRSINQGIQRARIEFTDPASACDISVTADCDISDCPDALQAGDLVEVVLNEPPGTESLISACLFSPRATEIVRSLASRNPVDQPRLEMRMQNVRDWKRNRYYGTVLVPISTSNSGAENAPSDAWILDNTAVSIVGANRNSRQIFVDRSDRLDVFDRVTVGTTVKATVRGIAPYGMFVSVIWENEEFQGLVPLAELAWGRIPKPETIYTPGDPVEAVIIDKTDDTKLKLSIKYTLPSPWATTALSLKEGTVIRGRIKKIADYGIFVEIVPGIDGLLHVSEMKPPAATGAPHDLYTVDELIEVTILRIDFESRKIRLGTED